MKIKKYEAQTEQEAIEKVKQELGLEALILNIKKTQPKGIFSIFRKPFVEVTAAYEEKTNIANKETINKSQNKTSKIDLTIAADSVETIKNDSTIITKNSSEENTPSVMPSNTIPKEINIKDKTIVEQKEKIERLEKRLNSTEGLLEKALSQLTLAQHNNKNEQRKYENNLIQIFYDALIEQGVTVDIAEELLRDISYIDDEDEIDLNIIVKVIYNKIINIIGEPEIVNIEVAEKGNPKIVVFMGPTGVGKTTTIAKLSSLFILNYNKSLALITADTYRIAAVEQLKTYGEILGVEVGTAYSNEDLVEYINNFTELNDIIIVDTAGRSHKNENNIKELGLFLKEVPKSERFLVLSSTTKFEDLLNIVNIYSKISDFKIIFTKLDETTCLGSILNICYLTGKKISYITNGQNVPDDIDVLQPEKIARALMGLGGI